MRVPLSKVLTCRLSRVLVPVRQRPALLRLACLLAAPSGWLLCWPASCRHAGGCRDQGEAAVRRGTTMPLACAPCRSSARASRRSGGRRCRARRCTTTLRTTWRSWWRPPAAQTGTMKSPIISKSAHLLLADAMQCHCHSAAMSGPALPEPGDICLCRGAGDMLDRRLVSQRYGADAAVNPKGRSGARAHGSIEVSALLACRSTRCGFQAPH